MRRYVLVAAILLPIALLATIRAYTRDTAAPKAPTQAEVVSSAGRPTAEQALVQWLQQPTSLPGGTILLWSGATKVPGPSPKDAEDLQYDTEINHFVLTDAGGSLYSADVQVAIDPRGGAKVIGGPSLTPLPAPGAGTWDGNGPWPGYTTGAAPSETVTSVIEAWAGAFTSGNAGQLRIVVGDPDSNHSYVPLSGVASATVAVTAAAALAEGRLMVRVSLPLSWTAQPSDPSAAGSAAQPSSAAPSSSAAATSSPTAETTTSAAPGDTVATYDLLVVDAASGAPRVVAWGGPGTGPGLAPYQNAVANVSRAAASPAGSTAEGGN